jgi:hypothetical protein
MRPIDIGDPMPRQVYRHAGAHYVEENIGVPRSTMAGRCLQPLAAGCFQAKTHSRLE